jgi:hypothetical protein
MRIAQQTNLGGAWLAVTALALLAGCTSDKDPQFGAVVQHNVAVQAVALEPVYAGVPIEGGDAVLGVTSVKQYKKGAVKELFTNTTTAFKK